MCLCAGSCPHLDRVLVLLSRRSPGDSWVTGASSAGSDAPAPAPAPAPAAAPAPAPAAAPPETRSRGQVDQFAVSEVRDSQGTWGVVGELMRCWVENDKTN